MTQDPTQVTNVIKSQSQLGDGLFLSVKLDPVAYGLDSPIGSLACYVDQNGLAHLYFKQTEDSQGWVPLSG